MINRNFSDVILRLDGNTTRAVNKFVRHNNNKSYQVEYEESMPVNNSSKIFPFNQTDKRSDWMIGNAHYLSNPLLGRVSLNKQSLRKTMDGILNENNAYYTNNNNSVSKSIHFDTANENNYTQNRHYLIYKNKNENKPDIFKVNSKITNNSNSNNNNNNYNINTNERGKSVDETLTKKRNINNQGNNKAYIKLSNQVELNKKNTKNQDKLNQLTTNNKDPNNSQVNNIATFRDQVIRRSNTSANFNNFNNLNKENENNTSINNIDTSFNFNYAKNYKLQAELNSFNKIFSSTENCAIQNTPQYGSNKVNMLLARSKGPKITDIWTNEANIEKPRVSKYNGWMTKDNEPFKPKINRFLSARKLTKSVDLNNFRTTKDHAGIRYKETHLYDEVEYYNKQNLE